MDEVETAAADTTSGSSPFPNLLPPLSALPDLSSHPPSPPPPPERELDEVSPQQASGFKRHHTGKLVPVGIAHPLQQQQREEKANLFSSSKSSLRVSGHARASGPLEGGEEGNSECSQSAAKKPKLADLSSGRRAEGETFESDDMASGIADFDLPVLSSSDSDNEEEQYKFTPPSYSLEEAREEGYELGEEEESMTRLPAGKEWHMFVTHSTSDIEVVKRQIMEPFSRGPRKATASYQYMAEGQYDNKAIQAAIRGSCLVLVTVSPPYLNSERCKKEWELAVNLARKGTRDCDVVVAAVGVCSRPAPLKPFLYLDFLDWNKRTKVWKMLEEEIDKAINRLSHSSGGPVPYLQLTSSTAPTSASCAKMVKEEHVSEEEVEEKEEEEEEEEGSYGSREMDDCASGFESMVQDLREQHQKRHQWQDEGRGGGGGRGRGGGVVSEGELGDTMREEGEVDSDNQTDATEQDILKHQEREEEEEEVEEGELSDTNSSGDIETSNAVADFYNELAKPDADKRNESPIFHMRNFNNWVKSILIRTHLKRNDIVLDLCCGKGGDLLKWKGGRIAYLVCADISETSVEACEERYKGSRTRDRRTREPPFEAEFIVADCCEVRLRDKYKNEGKRFNLTSCQFSLHYSFENYERAHMMLQNACEHLRPGGFFIGTTVDSFELIKRLREAECGEDGQWSIGNNVYSVTLDPSIDPQRQLPLFGAKYFFKLHGVVNLPEYVVHFPLLERMLAEFDMELVLRQNFCDFFQEHRHDHRDADLLFRMKAFNENGTMSDDEWEAIGLYLAFVFRKRRE